MSVTKEIIEQERQLVQAGRFRDVHLHREGAFLRAYDWSAWLCCRYLHDFRVNKRLFKGMEEAVHLVLSLPELMVADAYEEMADAYAEWKDALPLTESNPGTRKKASCKDLAIQQAEDGPLTLTSIMQRILAFPIESKSPLESMVFLADIKQRLATLI